VEPWNEGKPDFLGVHEPVPKCTSFAYKPSLKGAKYIYATWSFDVYYLPINWQKKVVNF
jgi:hypothetical protein